MMRYPPVAIEVALHYYSTPTDIDDGAFSPAHKQWIDGFVRLGLLMDTGLNSPQYKSTRGLDLYVDKLCGVQPPALDWTFKEVAK